MTYAITIDGPAGSGKSTLAKNLQKKLNGFTLVDTGAYYRWATSLCLDSEIDLQNKTKVYGFVKDKMELLFVPYPKGHKYYSARILHDGDEINKRIFTAKVTQSVPIVAQYKKLRDLVKKMIVKLNKDYNVIVAGRDIGTSVLPDAEIKIFLNPSVDARVRRRFRDEVKQGRAISLGKMKEEMNSRDHQDKTREHGPLKKPHDALEVDNTYMTASQCLKESIKYITKKEPNILKQEKVDWKNVGTKKTTTVSQIPTYSITNIDSNKTESMAELKKRLKAKYKAQQAGGGGNFFSRH